MLCLQGELHSGLNPDEDMIRQLVNPFYRKALHHVALLCSLLLAACGQAGQENITPTWTLVPSSTPTIEATATPMLTPTTPVSEATAEPTVLVEITPLAGSADPPPLDINLPQGWRRGYDSYGLIDVDDLRFIPVAVYQGPVTGGTGIIVLLWGFPSLVQGNPLLEASATPDIWVDALRLFRLAIVEAGCNPGTDLQRSYRVGGRAATGTQFAVIDCPESPDTRGWFAGLREGNLNFVFYVYTDPIAAMDSAQAELQAILDSVVFRVPG